MGKYANSSRSFNTLKHSNRAERSKRQSQSKYLILSICGAVILIVLALMVLLVGSLIPHKDHPLPSGKGETEIDFKSVTLPADDAFIGNLLLVNAQHEYKFLEDASLVAASNVTTPGCVKNGAIKVNAEALEAFDRMMKKYVEVESIAQSDVWLTEAYRTKAEQEGKQFLPGYSDHHTGRLLIIEKKGESGLPADNWLFQNCYKYGFVVRYPAAKSVQTGVSNYTYAFRYVGVAHATYLYEQNLCMEEYIVRLQNEYASGEKYLKITGADGNDYAVYSVRASQSGDTTVSLPKDLPYTVSGDNAGNLVVTVNLGKSKTE